MSKKLPIIIDTDPGIDDALALLLLSKYKKLFDIKLIASTAGNNPIETTTNNVKFFTKKYFNKTKVAIGNPTPLIRQMVDNCEEVHGSSGLGNISIPEIDYPIQPNNSSDEMAKILLASKEKITIIALGAMTNIAKMLINYPQIKEKINCIYTMIGSITGKGNITPNAEFNAYFDPDAISIVANSGVPLVINPFELAHNSKITKKKIQNISTTSKDSDLAKQLMLGINEIDTTKISIFDLHSIMAIIHSEHYDFIKCNIDIHTDCAECGKCVLTKSKNGIHKYQKLKDKNITNQFILDTLLK